MLRLKEWLELDRIRTEVFEPAWRETIADSALRQTAYFLLESLEGEEKLSKYRDYHRNFRKRFPPPVLDDPFSGSEDAKPVKGDEETGREKDTSQEDTSQEDTSQEDTSQEDEAVGDKVLEKKRIATALKDAALWIRWAGMLERRNHINALKSLMGRDSESEDPFGEMMKGKRDYNIQKAIPILEKLGYIDHESIEKNDKLSDKAKDKEVEEALEKALEESGNELPKGISEEEVKKEFGDATRNFMDILHSVLRGEYKKLSRSSWNAGEKLYSSDGDELSHQFTMRMFDSLYNRRIKSGSAEPWGGLIKQKKNQTGGRTSSNVSKKWFDFGQFGKDELKDNDGDVDQILDIFRNKLYREPHKAAEQSRRANSPSRGVADEIKNRSKKASRINLDINKALQDQAEGKEPESIRQYVEFLNAFLNGEEKKYDPSTMPEEQRFRYEIIEAMIAKQPRHPERLSLDPANIIKTLQNFRKFFVIKTMSGPKMLGSEDNEGNSTGLEQSASFHAYRRSAGDRPEEGLSGGSMGAGSVAMGNDTRRIIIEKLKEVMDRLRLRNPEWALAVCLKFDLECNSDGSGSSPENLLRAGVLMTKSGQVKGSKKLGCRNQLDAIGLTTDEVQKKLNKTLGREVGAANALRRGLEFVCSELQRALIPALQGTSAPTAGPNTRFDSSRPAPLAGVMRRSQG